MTDERECSRCTHYRHVDYCEGSVHLEYGFCAIPPFDEAIYNSGARDVWGDYCCGRFEKREEANRAD